jgi:hypothetical protein
MALVSCRERGRTTRKSGQMIFFRLRLYQVRSQADHGSCLREKSDRT